MMPAARVQAAAELLDQILGGTPAEQALLRWARGSRFAGSGDRQAVRDLVYDSLRKRGTRAALGGAETGRGLMIGMCREMGQDPAALFTGQGHAPAPLTPAEAARPDTPADPALDLPGWIAARLAADLGPDFPAVAAALRERAPVWLRVNAARVSPAQAQAALADDGVLTDPASALPTALRATAGERRVAASAAYREGLVELQDLSPQIACAALRVEAGERVLDYCAGGGGKALALAAEGARVTAHDADPARMRDLPARATRAGAAIALAPASPTGSFDLVVTDVPCSGSGTWRRTPDAKWRLTPEGLERLTALQAGIMDRAARHVRPGGRLAYMTCSLLRAENEDQIARFLSVHPEFRLSHAQTLTPLTASDGFFHAVLVRD
ncbi:RsmB/NOP family class I SAM-dependent RNA methyltransferase [Paracoccus sp. Z118]|uniref:RsmB/NOP family class I SAM-dependent RNA methyltransferase n=1 Tax=Paracoccus sp. Z118 TaxID=2851017 RepID=UPI001C2C6D6C|nr:RsmB/NOP family class I SAM-dependent RNA methyltransferase [Paracoccus sp. Z118]MBV0893092.1 RsmB/NOP family class I SAM-dependent RNA methyltransferase [Paracoccus sp. Z118]